MRLDHSQSVFGGLSVTVLNAVGIGAAVSIMCKL